MPDAGGPRSKEKMNEKRQYTMSVDAFAQRRKYGFKRNEKFSGEWTMVRMRKDVRDGLKRKFGSLHSAFEYALGGG